MAVETLSSYLNKSQIPFDAKLYAKTLAELAELGTNSNKAFTYYEDMPVNCVENHTTYVWREELTVGETGGILENGTYVYPAGVVANGISYGGRKFNFFPKIFTNVEVPLLSDKANKTNVLEKNNTTIYTPTTSYHPATYKFVVDLLNNLPNAVASITNTSNTITVTFLSGVIVTLNNFAKLDVSQAYSKQQVVSAYTLADVATIAWNLDIAQNAYVLLGGSRTLNYSLMKDGGVYRIAIKQDVTGSRTITWGSGFEFGDVGVPTLSITAGRTDILTFTSDGVNMFFLSVQKGLQNYKV
jgi:hypothetical protein